MWYDGRIICTKFCWVCLEELDHIEYDTMSNKEQEWENVDRNCWLMTGTSL